MAVHVIANCAAVWFGAFWVAARLTRFAGMRSHVPEEMMIAHGAASDAPFRGGAIPACMASLASLETAWFGAGLAVRREGRRLVLTLPGRGNAVIPLPETETFGGAAFDSGPRVGDSPRTW